MNIFKKNEKNTGNRLPTPDKVKKGFRWYCSLVAAVARNGVYGCQFHPEKSWEAGLQILKNFGELIG